MLSHCIIVKFKFGEKQNKNKKQKGKERFCFFKRKSKNADTVKAAEAEQTVGRRQKVILKQKKMEHRNRCTIESFYLR